MQQGTFPAKVTVHPGSVSKIIDASNDMLIRWTSYSKVYCAQPNVTSIESVDDCQRTIESIKMAQRHFVALKHLGIASVAATYAVCQTTATAKPGVVACVPKLSTSWRTVTTATPLSADFFQGLLAYYDWAFDNQQYALADIQSPSQYSVNLAGEVILHDIEPLLSPVKTANGKLDKYFYFNASDAQLWAVDQGYGSLSYRSGLQEALEQ